MRITATPSIDNTKIVVFKNLRDGCLILDEDDRVLFIKAHTIDLGDPEHSRRVTIRLMDDKYGQYSFVKIAKPRKYRRIFRSLKNKIATLWKPKTSM